MKKSEIAELLRNVKSGKIKIDEAITKAETSRKSLVWQEASERENRAVAFLTAGFLYKNENGKLAKLPEKRENKIFQPYYRSLESQKKLEEKAKARKKS